MPDFLKCQITTSLIEFHIVLKRNVKYLSDSCTILYPELERAKLKFNFMLWKKSKAKNIICKLSPGSVFRNTAGSWITSFPYNVDEKKKKKDSRPGDTVWSFTFSLMSTWVSLVFPFPPTSQRCAR